MQDDNKYIDDFVQRKLINHRVEPKTNFQNFSELIKKPSINKLFKGNISAIKNYFTVKNIFFSIIVVFTFGAAIYLSNNNSSEKNEEIRSLERRKIILNEKNPVKPESDTQVNKTVKTPHTKIEEKNVIIKKQIVVKDTLYLRDTIVIDEK